MSEDKLISKAQNKFSFKNLLRAFLALLGLGASLLAYYGLFYEKKPEIRFEITSEVNVLDIHKPLGDLVILFQGEDVQKKRLNLRIYNLRLENTGGTDIRQGDFDQQLIWGFRVQGGKIVDEPRWLESNYDYLKGQLNPRKIDDSTVEFRKTIFERDKYFKIEFLVLHGKDTKPSIAPLGKIAGIDHIRVVTTTTKKESLPFIERFFYGDMWINAIRIIFYPIVLLIGIIIIVIIGDQISSSSEKSRKKRIQEVLGKEVLDTIEDKDQFLAYFASEQYYLKEDLQTLKALLQNRKAFDEEVRAHVEIQKLQDEILKLNSKIKIASYLFRKNTLIDALLRFKIIILSPDGSVQVHGGFEIALDELIKSIPSSQGRRRSTNYNIERFGS